MPEDIFNAEPDNEPIDDKVEPEKGNKPEEKTVEELLELPDEELKKYGIDDPHNWKSYQKLLHKKEHEWAEERQRLEQKLNETSTRFEQFQKELEGLKKPKEEEKPLQKPIKPPDFDPVDMFDPTTPSGQWFLANQQYMEAREAQRERELQQLKEEIEREKRLKEAQQISEVKKAETINAFQELGLEPEDSVELYQKLERALTSPIKDGAKIFVEMYKAKKPQPKKKKLDNIIPPGMDGAGQIPEDDESKQFIDGLGAIKNKGIFETK